VCALSGLGAQTTCQECKADDGIKSVRNTVLEVHAHLSILPSFVEHACLKWTCEVTNTTNEVTCLD